MSALTLMGLGVKAMTANYAALQTTGNNIANANVTGYSRQSVDLATSSGQYTGSGFFGSGVDVTTVSRAHDNFLTTQSVTANSLSAMDASRLSSLQDIEKVFQTGEQGLGYAANQLFSAMADVAANPSDASARQVVLARASDMATQFSQAGSALDEVQSNLTSQIGASVSSINSLASQIASANQQIAALQGLGHDANDLLDQRDRLIDTLGQQVQITRIDASDGSASIFIAGGQNLVLGTHASQLKQVADASDPSRSAIALVEGNTTRTLDATTLGGGTLAGLMRVQNSDLVQARTLVGQLAAAVGGAVNAQQTLGLTLRTPLGQSGTALFSMGAARALPNAANAKDASGAAIGSVALTITDPSALQASEYDLRASTTTPGSWQLTRLSDGTVSTVNSGDTVDGMRIDLTDPQPGDSYLLQPVTRAANDMATLLTDARDLAAASPLTATTAAANTGTAAVSALTVNTSPLPTPGATAQISFTDDSGSYSWSLTDSSGAVVGSGTGVWTAGQSVPTAPADINGFSLQLSGVPKSGDVVSVAPTATTALAANNGNALAFVALSTAKLAGGQSASDDWAQALSTVGVSVQSAQTSASLSSSAATQAESARSSQAGVNLDEEAAKLIQFQQSYQAAAKVLQVAQTLFDTLLQTAASS